MNRIEKKSLDMIEKERQDRVEWTWKEGKEADLAVWSARFFRYIIIRKVRRGKKERKEKKEKESKGRILQENYGGKGEIR